MKNRAEIEAWARELYHEHVDRKDAAGFAAIFAENGQLRFGNEVPIVGRKNIETAIAQFFQAMESLRHEFQTISIDGDAIFLAAVVTYRRHDGKVVSVPAMTVFRTEGEAKIFRARSCDIYVDLAPLFS